jgi:hypothetical protein
MREHELRLEQLHEAPGGRTIFASILVSETDDGSTVSDLRALILERIGNDLELIRRLEAIVTQSLGRDWREAANRRFDLDAAREDLRLYLATQIPTIPQPLPAEIKHVRFVVDLSSIEAMLLTDARDVGDWFRDILPPAR